jgi:hypothetical protein
MVDASWPVDEFDSGVEPVTDEQAAELVKFVATTPNRPLAEEVTLICETGILHQFRHVLMPMWDDMRRIHAGREARFTRF